MQHQTLHRGWVNSVVRLLLCLAVGSAGLGAGFSLLSAFPVHAEPNAPCIAGSGTATPVAGTFCSDSKEPNDTFALAKSFDATPTTGLTFYTVDNNPADTDWYAVSLPAASVITLTASTSASVGGISMTGYINAENNPSGITSGGLTNAVAVISNTSTSQPVTAYFRVFNTRTTDYLVYQVSYVIAGIVVAPPTVTPIPGTIDAYEPNDTPDLVDTRKVSYINIGSQIQNVNFFTPTGPVIDGTPYPVGTRENGDVDWFFFYARKHVSLGGSGGIYRIATSISPGVDTEIFIFNAPPPTGPDIYSVNRPDNVPNLLGSNDDIAPTQRQSQFDLTAPVDGIYWIKVWNKDPTPRGTGQTYSISVVENPLPATNTPVATTSPVPATAFPGGFDQFEYNGDFSFSTLIAPNTKYSNLNFVPYQPPSPDTPDNDFFRLPVRQGLYYTCETLDLSQGTDTNIIIYSQSNYDSGITGNDNINEAEFQRGNFASRVSWLSGYTGYAYLLVGQVILPRANEAAGRTYALQCTIGLPNTPTPSASATPQFTPTPLVPPTPIPPEATLTPFPTPRLARNLPVRELPPVGGEVIAVPTPAATPMPISLDVQVFTDQNKNGLLDRSEGIANVSVRILDENTQTPLGQAFTDGEGRVRFAITNDGPIRLSVPLFGYSTVVSEPNTIVRIGLVPQLQVPDRIP